MHRIVSPVPPLTLNLCWRTEMLHIYEGHESDGAVFVEHVAVKCRHATPYTEFVKQRKGRISSALMASRSSPRRSSGAGLAARSPSLSLVLPPPSSFDPLHNWPAHYQPAVFPSQLFFPTLNSRRAGCSRQPRPIE